MIEHEGVIEGRPQLNVDWNAEYAKQRRSRMDDCLADYMGDEDVSPRQCYEDMLSVCTEWIEYHKENMARWTELKSLMLGHREFDLEQWENFPNESGDYWTGGKE